MAKRDGFLLLALLSLSMVTTLVMANDDESKQDDNEHGEGSLKKEECPSECSRRCSKTHHHKPCMRYCKQCCEKCLCVPPGTYGNKELCPCYNNWKTKRGGPKCP